MILTRMFDSPGAPGAMPRPFGVLYARERATYDQLMSHQMDMALDKMGAGNLDELIAGSETWEIA